MTWFRWDMIITLKRYRYNNIDTESLWWSPDYGNVMMRPGWPKMAQDCSSMAHHGPKRPKIASRRPRITPKMTQDGLKMTPRIRVEERTVRERDAIYQGLAEQAAAECAKLTKWSNSRKLRGIKGRTLNIGTLHNVPQGHGGGYCST